MPYKSLKRHAPGHAIEDIILFMRGKTVIDTNGCWVLNFGQDSQGYARITWRGRRWRAHNLIAFICLGLTNVDIACHKCNNKSCWRPGPKHVYRGSHESNTLDSLASGARRVGRPKGTRVLGLRGRRNG